MYSAVNEYAFTKTNSIKEIKGEKKYLTTSLRSSKNFVRNAKIRVCRKTLQHRQRWMVCVVFLDTSLHPDRLILSRERVEFFLPTLYYRIPRLKHSRSVRPFLTLPHVTLTLPCVLRPFCYTTNPLLIGEN